MILAHLFATSPVHTEKCLLTFVVTNLITVCEMAFVFHWDLVFNFWLDLYLLLAGLLYFSIHLLASHGLSMCHYDWLTRIRRSR